MPNTSTSKALQQRPIQLASSPVPKNTTTTVPLHMRKQNKTTSFGKSFAFPKASKVRLFLARKAKHRGTSRPRSPPFNVSQMAKEKRKRVSPVVLFFALKGLCVGAVREKRGEARRQWKNWIDGLLDAWGAAEESRDEEEREMTKHF